MPCASLEQTLGSLVRKDVREQRETPMKLYRTRDNIVVQYRGVYYGLGVGASNWDEWLNQADLSGAVARALAALPPSAVIAPPLEGELLAPVGRQEVWAAGVTYLRSRTARMEESSAAGGGSFYDRVYEAQRPEIFLKATPGRVVAPGASIRVRRDSDWDVPEPEGETPEPEKLAG
jgi:2-dehydro-3-deoxy-D-arabinonate dehydratase